MEIQEDEEMTFSSVKRNEDLKSNLIAKLGVNSPEKNVELANRSRVNSLRNGETAKVL